jgi:hypothetical protein
VATYVGFRLSPLQARYLYNVFNYSQKCVRWGYHDIDETRQQVINMRIADIPLEGTVVIWIVFTLIDLGYSDVERY